MLNHINREKIAIKEPVKLNPIVFDWATFIAFTITFCIMELATPLTSNLGDGMLFFMVGVLVSSYGILPLFENAQRQYPRQSVLWFICDIVVIVGVTCGAYYLCFSHYNILDFMM